MTLSDARDGPAFLSTLPAQRGNQRAAAAVAVATLLVFCAAVPFAQVPLRPFWAFIPIYESVLVINDLVTAMLLFGQYAILGARGLLVLACGYLFTASTAAVHALTFPGLFTATGLLGAGPQTTAWLYMLWHGGFGLFVIGFVRCGDARHPATQRARTLAWAVAGTLGVTLLCSLLVTAGRDLLPPIMAGSHYTPLMRGIVTSVWLISLAALVVVWRHRQRSVLHLWLAVVMLVWLIDIALSAMLNAGRFDLGFYAGRLYGLLANSVVLMILMVENAGIHARLLATTTELQAANQELDTFAQAVSHDLRAPLRAMSGFSVALVEDHGEQLPDEARSYLREIQDASRRMSSLVDGLLTLSRSTRGGLQRDSIDLNAMVERIRAELGRAEPAREVHWQVAPAMSINGDPRMVDVVMRNLLGNAWKYTARTDRAAIQVYAEGPAGARCIVVNDNGAGFDMARAGQLFKPFQRLHRQDEFPGHGIGLATVQRIVQRHGGGIRAVSTPGRGATFCFRLAGGPPDAPPVTPAPQGDDGRC